MAETYFTLPPFSRKALSNFWSKVVVRTTDECWQWTAAKDKDGYGGFGVNKNGTKIRAHRIAYCLAFGAFPARLFVLHSCDNPSCVNSQHLFLGTARDNSSDMVAKGRQAKGDKSSVKLHPEMLHRGDDHWTHRHPEKLARGDRSGSRTHPEKVPRGENCVFKLRPEISEKAYAYLREHPEVRAKGERNGGAKLKETQVKEIRHRFAQGDITKKQLAREYNVGESTVGRIIKRTHWTHII